VAPQVKLKDMHASGQLEQLLQYAQTTQLQCSLVRAAASPAAHARARQHAGPHERPPRPRAAARQRAAAPRAPAARRAVAPTPQLTGAIAAVAIAAVLLHRLMNPGRPVYLLDFAMAKPPEDWKFPRRTFLKASACNPVRRLRLPLTRRVPPRRMASKSQRGPMRGAARRRPRPSHPQLRR
jgi:hypothetical protein